MRFAGVIAALSVLFGVSSLAEHLGDRELFVGPPDAVAEGFVRKVVMERYEEAEMQLANAEKMREADLRTLRERLTRGVGALPSRYEAEVESLDGASARVKVTLSKNELSETFTFELVFDSVWKIVSRSGS